MKGAWGNGVARPWYKHKHPQMVTERLEPLGFTVEPVGPWSLNPGSAPICKLQVTNARGISQATFTFTEAGLFRAAQFNSGVSFTLRYGRSASPGGAVGLLGRVLDRFVEWGGYAHEESKGRR